ncbi:MAG: PAS domain S-box protein [Cyclobacteriaceae bacterium]
MVYIQKIKQENAVYGRPKADEALESASVPYSEAFFKFCQQQTDICIWELTAEGRLYLSDNLYDFLFGDLNSQVYPPSLAYLARMLDARDYYCLKASFSLAFAQALPFERQIRLHTRCGKIHARINAFPQPAQDGHVKSCVGFFQNVSEQKKVEKLLIQQEQRYQSIYQHHTGAIFILDTEGKLLEGNAKLEAICGYTSEELRHSYLLPLVAPEDRERVHEHFRKALNGEPQSYQAFAIHKDGRRIKVQVSNIPVYVEGEISNVYGILSDITEEHEAKEKLQEKLSLLQAIQESTNDSIFVLDLQGNYLFFNHVHEQNIWELYREKISIGGNAIKMMKRGPDFIHVENYLSRAYRGEAFTVEDQFGPPDNIRYFQVSYQPVFKEESVSGVGIFSRDISRQKRHEEAISRSRQMYEALFNNNPLPLIVYDISENQLISVNEAACLLFGYSREEMLKLNILNLVPEEDRAEVIKLYKQTYQQNLIEIDNLKNLKKDGSTFHAKLIAHSINFEGREARLVLLEDVTEKKLAEQQRQALGRIIDYSVNEVYIFDARNLHFLYLSKSALKNLQYSQDELMQMTPLDIKPEMDAHTFMSQLRPLLQEESKEVYFEATHQRKDGTQYPVRIQVQNADYTGRKVYISIVTDVTRERNVAAEIEQNKRFIESIADTSPELLYVYDLQQNKYIYFSNHIEDMLGYKADDVLNGKLQFMTKFHPEDLEKVAINFMHKILQVADDEVVETEYRVQHRDGHWVWLSSRDKPFKRDAAGNVIQTVGAAQDITRRMEYEQRLEQQNEILKKTNAELDRFVYSSSHDLRAPLASVLGLINVALMEDKPDEKDKYIRMMEGSIHRLDRFIQDIINYSRNTRLEASQDTIDFPKLISETLADLSYMDDINAVKFETYYDTDAPFSSDLQRLSVIFSNLISNAIRYRSRSVDQSYVKIMISTDAEKAVMRVMDNGIGIASEYQQKVFDMFFKASHEKHGSGIGLYIVKETTDVLGGSITLESKTRVGTTFTITLPNLLNRPSDQPLT